MLDSLQCIYIFLVYTYSMYTHHLVFIWGVIYTPYVAAYISLKAAPTIYIHVHNESCHTYKYQYACFQTIQGMQSASTHYDKSPSCLSVVLRCIYISSVCDKDITLLQQPLPLPARRQGILIQSGLICTSYRFAANVGNWRNICCFNKVC